MKQFIMMKRLIVLLSFAFASSAFAQEKVILTDGTELSVKILEIDNTNIKYKKIDLPEGPVFNILKEQIFKITYTNGKSEVFQQNLPALKPQATDNKKTDQPFIPNGVITDANMYLRGQTDAKNYYKAPMTTIGGVLIGGLGGTLAPLGGVLLPMTYSAIVASSPVNVRKNFSETDLLKNASYIAGYNDEAYRKKIRNLYLGAGITFSVATLIWGVAAVTASTYYY